MAFIKAPLDVLFKTAGKGIVNGLSRTVGRLLGSGISTDSRIVNAKAKWSGRSDKKDWRVRLQVPEGPLTEFFDFDKNPLLQPLAGSRGMFWPLTPSMVIQHSANYNAMAQTHSNYPFQAYQNSQVDSMNIIGEFPVQNSEDAKHWVATVNFLRTATKMFFGKDEGTGKGLKGNPPPILHLFGYGDHMFHKIPVVLNSFNVELRAGIDYISTRQNPDGYSTPRTRERMGLPELEEIQTWAPTLSNISVLITPIYSRENVKNFSMSKFVRGELNGKDSNEVGFI
jgi:hypothetical protein